MSGNDLVSGDLNNYQAFLDQATQQTHQTRIRVARNTSAELINLYWWLGEHIHENQNKHGWGKSVVEKLSHDLKKIFPSKTGFSQRNLWDMR